MVEVAAQFQILRPQIIGLRVLLSAAIAAEAFAYAGYVSIDHDKVQPFEELEDVTVLEGAAVKAKLSLQIIYGASRTLLSGETSGELKGTGDYVTCIVLNWHSVPIWQRCTLLH